MVAVVVNQHDKIREYITCVAYALVIEYITHDRIRLAILEISDKGD